MIGVKEMERLLAEARDTIAQQARQLDELARIRASAVRQYQADFDAAKVCAGNGCHPGQQINSINMLAVLGLVSEEQIREFSVAWRQTFDRRRAAVTDALNVTTHES